MEVIAVTAEVRHRAALRAYSTVSVGAALATIALLAGPVLAFDRAVDQRRVPARLPDAHAATSHHSTRVETLWIFDADFEDLVGDNAGWLSEDRSGTLAVPNYWHKDTIRINGFTHLGDSTWWCGKYDPCWRQPRGYGNDWTQVLSRAFPEVSEYAGQAIEIRFRFESDGAYSSEDTDNNPPWNSCLDGAWQLDNLTLTGGSPVHVIFLDDCESPGDNDWAHDDIPASGQTGVTYRRSYEEFAGHSGWMMAAYDSVTGAMVDGERRSAGVFKQLCPAVDVLYRLSRLLGATGPRPDVACVGPVLGWTALD
jgi:hypothetical protein